MNNQPPTNPWTSAVAKKARLHQKKYNNFKTRGGHIQPNDMALVELVAFDGKQISDKWEEDMYGHVFRQPNEVIPVFDIRNEDGTGRIGTSHRL